jgi:hypothetical protein
MAYTNLPPNLYDYFSTINQRIRKLESAPDQSMTTAVSAQSTANAAYAQAINASIQATNAAYTAGVAYSSASGKNTTNYASYAPSPSSNNTNGTVPITGDLWFVVNPSTGYASDVYTYKSGSWGHSPLDGSSNVILNIDAGKLVAGTIIANVAISNGSGTFYVDRYGNLSATSASIQGTIIATSGSFTGSLYSSNGTIGGFSLTSYALTGGGLSISSSSGQISSSASIVTSSTITAGSTMTAQGYFYNSGYATTTSSANAYINSSTGLLARSSSSLRYKLNVEPEIIPNQSILALAPKSFIDKASADAQGSTDGLPRILGLIAEEVAEIPVLADLLMNKNEEGQPDSVNYDRVAVALIPLLKDHEARLAKLEGANGTTTSN